jgi:hypothetical protein
VSGGAPDDIGGVSSGHFVILYGYDRTARQAMIADPYLPNPFQANSHYYRVTFQRLINSIMLGMITYDANLLVIEKENPGHPASSP